MNDVYTEDFSKFGFRELDEAGKLLTAIKNGLPSDFYDEGIKVGFNMNSGFVFLTNSEYQVAMLDDKGKLYSFYTTPYEGYEGSLEELLEEYDNMNNEDKDFVDELVSRGYWYIINCCHGFYSACWGVETMREIYLKYRMYVLVLKMFKLGGKYANTRKDT